MRRALPLAVFALGCTLFTNSIHAQNDRFAYAITDITKDGAGWNALRRVDLQTGISSQVLLNGSDASLTVFDAASRKKLNQQPDARYGTLLQSPFGTGVAAAAYDRKHNRLYFTPMFVDQLRYIDLSSMKVYYVTGQPFTGLGNMHNDEGKIVTRMVIAPDGYGYAITNDANTFIRFTTGRKTKIEQLGSIVDDPANKGISIHNRCSSFGGDMISDDEGNLFILSARNNVFQVHTDTRVATHIGTINGLSSNFTVNGAVVDGDGNLLVSSAVDGNAYYVVNPKNWSARPYTAQNGIFRSSDLANSNFLSSRGNILNEIRDVVFTPPVIEKNTVASERFAKQISVFPNPVTGSNITVQFSRIPTGNYMLELRDVLGRVVLQRQVTINAELQTQAIRLEERNAKGVYMIKVFDNANVSVFTQKLVVQ